VNLMPDGRSLCIADNGNDRLLVISPDGGQVLRTVRLEGSLGSLKFHTGIAANEDAFFVIDNNAHCVRKLRLKDGAPVARVGKMGHEDGNLAFPEGLALLGGRMYVADGGNNRICVFDTDMRFCFSFGQRGSVPGKLNGPVGLAPDDENSQLFVADSSNHRLAVFSEKGKFRRCIGSKGSAPGCFMDPCGIALAHGNVYVAEYQGRRIQVLTPLGEPLQILFLPGKSMLAGICATPYRMYVADPSSNVLHVLEVNWRFRNS